MSGWFTDVDASFMAGILGVAMLTAWGVTWRWSRGHRPTPTEGPSVKFNDAVLALLGLLLAFTFSLSLAKHEQRRQMAVTDSNAIGDFYACAGMLKDPVRNELQSVLREYLQARIDFSHRREREIDWPGFLDSVRKAHDRMQTLVQRAIDDGTPVVVPLVNTLNGLTSNHAARMAAVQDRLPPSIVFLLGLAAILSMGLVGRQQAISSEVRPGVVLSFTFLICLIVWVILDLNQPNRGLITISQQPLEELQKAMNP